MAIFESRGLFWWGHEPIPNGKIAPNSCVAGLLKIEGDGSISLELDGYLPNEHGPFTMMQQRELPADKSIRGLLKGSGEQVVLLELIRNGGQFKTNGISYEQFAASTCLVSEHSPLPDELMFRELILPLSGYEEWLRTS